MPPIIEIKNLGKKYNITHQRGGYIALRDVLTNIFKSPFKFLKHKAKQAVGKETKKDFWALKDVSFEVQLGEVIGIIGANGTGKSTLLKILSQITPPTEGEIIMRGTVGSLLEVGTGFHPELTGRENIFLNGAILGMPQKEIAKKFDAIVEFAGIDKFLDTPVKHYSSGMYVRLAFSVAAHMEPDILIIDEVLAVGDAEFQKKCLGKMEDITKSEGRTILFVSHNMGAIRQLCQKCVWLERGQIKKIGETEEVIEEYLNLQIKKTDNKNLTNQSFFKDRNIINGKKAIIKNVQTKFNVSSKSIQIKIEIESLAELKIKNIGIGINNNGTRITTIESQNEGLSFQLIRGINNIHCEIPITLNPNRYSLLILLESSIQQEDYIDDHNIVFDVPNYDFFNKQTILTISQGNILIKAKWKI